MLCPGGAEIPAAIPEHPKPEGALGMHLSSAGAGKQGGNKETGKTPGLFLRHKTPGGTGDFR